MTALPDIEQAVITALRADTALTAIVDPIRISTNIIPADSRQWLIVTLSGGGVALMRGWTRQPVLTFHVLGTTSDHARSRPRAATLAADAVRAVEDLTGTTTGGVIITAADVLSEPHWLPDWTYAPWRARYVFTARFIAHPTTL